MESPGSMASPAPSGRETFVLLSRGGKRFCVSAGQAEGVVEYREPAPLPRAPEAVLGLIAARGKMLTLIDLSPLLDGKPESQSPSGNRIAVVLTGDEQFALAADAHAGAIEIEPGQITQPGAACPQLVRGIISDDAGEIAVLDPSAIFVSAFQSVDRRRHRS